MQTEENNFTKCSEKTKKKIGLPKVNKVTGGKRKLLDESTLVAEKVKVHF